MSEQSKELIRTEARKSQGFSGQETKFTSTGGGFSVFINNMSVFGVKGTRIEINTFSGGVKPIYTSDVIIPDEDRQPLQKEVQAMIKKAASDFDRQVFAFMKKKGYKLKR